MKTKIKKSIICDNLKDFQSVLKHLDKMGYVDGREGQVGTSIHTYGISEYHFNLGLRVVNLYDNKTVKYAATEKGLKNVTKAKGFLNEKP